MEDFQDFIGCLDIEALGIKDLADKIYSFKWYNIIYLIKMANTTKYKYITLASLPYPISVGIA